MVTPLVLCDFLVATSDDEGKDIWKMENWYQKHYPPGNSHIPPGEKENHRLKSALVGDMLVPWRVHH